MRVKQALVAPHISFFKKDFLDKNNLVEYFDINQPCILINNEISF